MFQNVTRIILEYFYSRFGWFEESFGNASNSFWNSSRMHAFVMLPKYLWNGFRILLECLQNTSRTPLESFWKYSRIDIEYFLHCSEMFQTEDEFFWNSSRTILKCFQNNFGIVIHYFQNCWLIIPVVSVFEYSKNLHGIF